MVGGFCRPTTVCDLCHALLFSQKNLFFGTLFIIFFATVFYTLTTHLSF
jgi:hypothetical protein